MGFNKDYYGSAEYKAFEEYARRQGLRQTFLNMWGYIYQGKEKEPDLIKIEEWCQRIEASCQETLYLRMFGKLPYLKQKKVLLDLFEDNKKYLTKEDGDALGLDPLRVEPF